MSSPEAIRAGPGPSARQARVWPALGAVLILSALPAGAQTGAVAPLVAPRTATGEAYLAAVSGKGLQVPVVYLPPGAPLDAAVSAPVEERDVSGGISSLVKTIAWGVIALLVGGLVFALWRGRRNLRDLAGPKQRDFARRPEAPAEAMPGAALDQDLIARLQDEADPREGLRRILQRFLALAAKDNALPLKRSLTTRELMHRLPGSWAHRDALEVLARRTELVVFGGREISREAYEECLDLARPFLRQMAAA